MQQSTLTREMQNITGSARSHGWVRMARLTLDTCMFGYRNPQDSQAYRRPAAGHAQCYGAAETLPRERTTLLSLTGADEGDVA